MSPKISYRSSCRVCENKDLFLFLELPNMPMPTGHVCPDSEEEAYLADLRVYWCPECGVVQTLHDVDLSNYYVDYSYTVSRSPFVQRFMKQFAEEVWKDFELNMDDVVIEVGSSDGYQLKCFMDLGARVLGFEPSSELAEASRKMGIHTSQSLFTGDTIDIIPEDMIPVRAVITQYTFDHLPDPIGFLRAISRVIDPERGIIVIEVHDFEKIVERMEACLFTHEHSTYLSSDSFLSIFERSGFRLIRTDLVSENIRRGNSLIVVATLIGSRISSIPLKRSMLLERLRTQQSYIDFSKGIWESHASFASHIREMRSTGKRVAGYGAAARGINTLTIAGLTKKEIEYVCDINPKLHGLMMPGLGIPVVSPEYLMQNPVDEVVVFSYGYIDEIRSQLAPYIESGGRVVSMLDYFAQGNRS